MVNTKLVCSFFSFGLSTVEVWLSLDPLFSSCFSHTHVNLTDYSLILALSMYVPFLKPISTDTSMTLSLHIPFRFNMAMSIARDQMQSVLSMDSFILGLLLAFFLGLLW